MRIRANGIEVNYALEGPASAPVVTLSRWLAANLTMCCHAIAGLGLTDRLGTIALPTLVIVGEDDPGTPVAAAEVIHRHITGSQLRILKSASHLSNLEQPEAFNRALADFLAEVDGDQQGP
ncbi:MAG: alpha/beta hydrolase [Candidatus Rokubacteria bacterium]|nr:alpha/beta hydrolase [Candidatus Rokubacteria bacterium]